MSRHQDDNHYGRREARLNDKSYRSDRRNKENPRNGNEAYKPKSFNEERDKRFGKPQREKWKSRRSNDDEDSEKERDRDRENFLKSRKLLRKDRKEKESRDL